MPLVYAERYVGINIFPVLRGQGFHADRYAASLEIDGLQGEALYLIPTSSIAVFPRRGIWITALWSAMHLTAQAVQLRAAHYLRSRD